MNWSPSMTRRGTRRGFTLVEIMLVVVITVILAALIAVAIGQSIRSARRVADQRFAGALELGVEQFRQNFGFLPPLVDDSNPLEPLGGNPPLFRPRLAGETVAANAGTDDGPTQFLRWTVAESAAARHYSEHSLPYYLLGTLGATVDGVDGGGFTKPRRDGSFTRSGPTVSPLVDFQGNAERLVDPGTARARLVAGSAFNDQAQAFRYYRWEPLFHTGPNNRVQPASFYPGAPDNDPARAGAVRSLNFPPFLGPVTSDGDPLNPRLATDVRDATFAIVHPGPDGLINEADPDAPENKDNIVEVGK